MTGRQKRWTSPRDWTAAGRLAAGAIVLAAAFGGTPGEAAAKSCSVRAGAPHKLRPPGDVKVTVVGGGGFYRCSAPVTGTFSYGVKWVTASGKRGELGPLFSQGRLGKRGGIENLGGSCSSFWTRDKTGNVFLEPALKLWGETQLRVKGRKRIVRRSRKVKFTSFCPTTNPDPDTTPTPTPTPTPTG